MDMSKVSKQAESLESDSEILDHSDHNHSSASVACKITEFVDQPEAIKLVGNIDAYEQGLLSGWAMYEDTPSEPVNLKVYEDNRLVGECIANEFREDLKAIGTGTGQHGFKINLDEIYYDGLKHNVQVVDANSTSVLGNYTFHSQAFANSYIDEIARGYACGRVILTLEGTVSEFDIELLADGEVCATGTCSLVSDSKYSFRVKIPDDLYDNIFHLYSVQLKWLPTKGNLIQERIKSISTPWKYLCNDISAQGLSTISKISGFRYESLQAQLRTSNSCDIENLMRAHDVLVEGFEDRKKYPKRKLPAVENPDISIIVPTYNSTALTYNCIAAIILSTEQRNYEVVVVDDCPEDNSDLSEHIENLRVIKNEKNLGFLQSCNMAVERVSGDYIALLNSDTEVTQGWLRNLQFVFEHFDNVGLVGSKLIYPDGRLQEAGGVVWGNGKPWNYGNRMNPENPRYCYTRQADYVSGAAMMIPKEIWNQVGQFSLEYFPAYYEDTDLAFKIRKAGFKTMYCADSVVVHYEGMSNGVDLEVGMKRHELLNAPKFRAKWRSDYKHNGKEAVDVHLEKDRNIDFRVLMIDYTTPRPDQDAGSYAAVKEISLLQELGCKVTFLPNNLAHMGVYTKDLQKRGVECIHAPYYANSVEFIEERGQEFDLVYITRFDVAEDVLESIRAYSDAKIVLNNADLHFLRELRAAVAANSNTIDEPLKTRERELAVMQSVDAVLSYNEVEHSVIASHNMASENIFKCPWVLEKKKATASFEDRVDIAFLGGFNHLPNREAVAYFVNNVMPGIRKKLPGVNFKIYGSNVTKEVENLAADDVLVKGYIENLDDLFDSCRVFIAPLISGAGIKGKVLESVSYGVPCVLSPVAAESTGLVHDISTLISTSDEEWVSNIEKLYTDRALWEKLSASSSALSDDLYSFDAGLESMRAMMSYLELDPALGVSKLLRAS